MHGQLGKVFTLNTVGLTPFLFVSPDVRYSSFLFGSSNHWRRSSKKTTEQKEKDQQGCCLGCC